ncbi:DUF4397 domain-containing protein [Haloarcula amylovorans]|uniref:DUF4397 domain-containing protein n=1 Tax=Haloarcula amylovorans TaxID=2562280 RepID=UPI0014314150|nr:DUF4397 domain-containing protein [Halomicroarcula amylolytica]
MTDHNVTRRRVVQGAGAFGVAGVVGSSVVTAQQQTETTQENSAALRVAHASPDAPSIEVRLDGETAIDGVSFRNVSSYNEVDPGTYQLQVVATEQGFLGGVLDDLFGDSEGEGTVLFDQEVTLESGTTYTAVGFGEVARGPTTTESDGGTGTETDGGIGETTTETETASGLEEAPTDEGAGDQSGSSAAASGETLVEGLSFGEHDTFEVGAGEYSLVIEESSEAGLTDGGTVGEQTGTETEDGFGEESTPSEGDQSNRGFQVSLLEDDLSAPGEETARVRVFHAVPDVDSVTVSVSSEATSTEQGGTDGGTATPGESGGTETDTGTTTEGGQTDGGTGAVGENARQATVSVDGGAVYSGFALGYFDPDTAAAAEAQTGTETDGTPAETATERTPGGTGTEDGVSTRDPSGEEFELVVVQDAQEGERSDGGTGEL